MIEDDDTDFSKALKRVDIPHELNFLIVTHAGFIMELRNVVKQFKDYKRHTDEYRNDVKLGSIHKFRLT